jgi:hypothetical protein
MNIDFQGLLEILPTAGKGWLGVFVVTAIIILAVYGLNLATGRSGK